MNYEPGAPCVKVFFFCKIINYWRTIEACSGLKSRGLGDSAPCRSGRNYWKTIVNIRTRPRQCWINFSTQDIIWKTWPNTARQRQILWTGDTFTHGWYIVFSTQLVNCCPHGRRKYTCVLLPLSLLSDLPPPSERKCTVYTYSAWLWGGRVGGVE